MNNKIEFTQAQQDLITMVYHHPDKFDVKIDAVNQVCIFDKVKDEPIHRIGEVGRDLVIKLFSYMGINASEDDEIRVVKVIKKKA